TPRWRSASRIRGRASALRSAGSSSRSFCASTCGRPAAIGDPPLHGIGRGIPPRAASGDPVHCGFAERGFPGSFLGMPPVPRILLAEDEQIVRQGIRALLEQAGFEIVAEASDGREAIRLAPHLRPDIAVLDLAMPNMNGTTAAQELARVAPGTRVVVLTAHREDEQVLAALEAGIEGYVLKTEATADLVRALREVVRGRTYLSPGI